MHPPVELGDLTSGERDAVTLVYFEHLTLKQAALALATDTAGIGRRLSRAYASIAGQVMAVEPAGTAAEAETSAAISWSRRGDLNP